MRLRPSVLLALRNRQAFYEHLDRQQDLGTIWIPGYAHRTVGDTVDLEIAFAEERMLFHSRAIVRWKRIKAQPKLPAGIGVEFLEEEAKTRKLILDFASQRDVNVSQRRTRRYPAVLDVKYMNAAGQQGTTGDISQRGASIVTEHPLEIGTLIQLTLKGPQDQDIDLQAEVRWNREDGQTTTGVQFVLDNTDVQFAIRSLVEEVRAQHDRDIAAS